MVFGEIYSSKSERKHSLNVFKWNAEEIILFCFFLFISMDQQINRTKGNNFKIELLKLSLVSVRTSVDWLIVSAQLAKRIKFLFFTYF